MATSAKEWKGKQGIPLTLPSGNEIKARRNGLEAFLASGKVPNALIPMMQKSMKGDAPDVKEIIEKFDLTLLGELQQMYDMIAVKVIVDPVVYPVPDEGVARDDELLYADDVDNTDKAFLFQWASGGTADVEKFRGESAKYVAALQSGEEVPTATSDAIGNP